MPTAQVPAELEAVNASVELWWDDGADSITKDKDPLYRIEDVTQDVKIVGGKMHIALISKDASFSDYNADDDDSVGGVPLPKGAIDIFTPTVHDYDFKVGEEIFYIDIPVTDLEDDIWGWVEEYTKNLAEEVAKRRRVLTGYKTLKASTARCYTGLSFYNTAQKIDPTNSGLGEFQNLWALELSKTNFEQLYGYMQTIPDESGRPAGNKPSILMVAPQKQSLGEEIVKAVRGSFGADNVNLGKVELRVNPFWADEAPEMWDLYAASGSKKPLGYGSKVAPKPEYHGVEKVQGKRVHRWEVRVRDRMIYVDPRKALRSIPAP